MQIDLKKQQQVFHVFMSLISQTKIKLNLKLELIAVVHIRILHIIRELQRRSN